MTRQDAAQRRRAEEALRENAQRMRAIWETTVDGILTIDERGIIESLNPAACRIFGYAPEEVIGRNISVLMPSPDRERHDSYLANYLRSGEAKIIGIGREVTGRRQDGSTFPMDLSVGEVRLGEQRLFTGIVRDVTERHRAQAALRESAQRMRAVLETVVDGILTIDERGCIESLNPAASRLFGYAPEEVVGRNVSMLMPSPYRQQHDSYLANYLRSGEAKIIGIGREVSGQRKDGTVFPMELSVGEVQLGARRLFTGIVRDISERRHLELAAAAATEQERARIARELHDGLGQQLGGLLFMLKGLERDLGTADSPLTETVEQLGRELATALQQARHLAHELYTVEATPDGLLRALETLAERVAIDPSLACEFTGDATALLPDVVVANHLYRIAQEAVHNARKHSGATRLDLELIRVRDSIELRVRDNGVGLPAEPGTAGFGLRSMEQRARLIGGRLAIGAAPGGGTEVACMVPLPADTVPHS